MKKNIGCLPVIIALVVVPIVFSKLGIGQTKDIIIGCVIFSVFYIYHLLRKGKLDKYISAVAVLLDIDEEEVNKSFENTLAEVRFEGYCKSADNGKADAQLNLGLCFYSGKGVAQDQTQAVYWFRKAAEQGIAEAQNNLGFCLDNGNGITQDQTQAVHWYLKAAKQGCAEAQYNLGHSYANGGGVIKDQSKAIHWYSRAAAQGYVAAQLILENRKDMQLLD